MRRRCRLRAIFWPPEPAAERRPAALADAEGRIQLAHRFYNEAVSDTRALRLRPAVRLFHLGGTAKLPEYFDYMLAE